MFGGLGVEGFEGLGVEGLRGCLRFVAYGVEGKRVKGLVILHTHTTYLWLVGNGGMGYNYNHYYYHSSIPY